MKITPTLKIDNAIEIGKLKLGDTFTEQNRLMILTAKDPEGINLATGETHTYACDDLVQKINCQLTWEYVVPKPKKRKKAKK